MISNGQNEQGGALLETVLTLPLVLLLMLGMGQIALLYQKQIELDYACFRAARIAIVHADQEGWLEKAKKGAKNAMNEKFSFSKIKSTLSSLFNFKSFLSEPEIEISMVNEGEEIALGTPIQLRLDYTYPFVFPFVRKLYESKYGESEFHLKSECALTSEVGKLREI